jgi:general secretion pathway protein F
MKLSDAMRPHGKVFNDLFVNMVNAGENSGALDQVLKRLADFSEGQARLKSKVTGAMMYPLIMTVVGTLLIIVLMIGVIPKITSIFADQGMTLPLITRMVMAVSNALSSPWFLAGFAVFGSLAAYGIRRWLRTSGGKLFLHRRFLKWPLFGRLTRMVAVSRFSRTLSTLLSSGVPLLTAMDIVKNIVSNVVIRRVIEETAVSVKEGASVSDTLKKSGEFPPIVIHMIAIGEKTGELEQMLTRVADNYDMQVENTISTLTTLLEPIMILAMPAVVSFIVMAVLLPILQMGEMVG